MRGSLEDVRRIAIELRPEALDDLGLESALAVLCERFAERSGLAVRQQVARPSCRTLSPDERARRIPRGAGGADERRAPLRRRPRPTWLAREDGALTLTVTDDGDGLPAATPPATGIRGMRERATLIGATLTIDGNPAGRGCRVRLEVPIGDGR